jgi:hypothetical protein
MPVPEAMFLFSDVPMFHNSYSQIGELNTCMVQVPVGGFWDVVLCSVVEFWRNMLCQSLLEVAGFLEVLVPSYITALRTSNFNFFSPSRRVGLVLVGQNCFFPGCHNHHTLVSFDVSL